MRFTLHPGLSTATALQAQRQLGRSALTNHGHWWEVVVAWWAFPWHVDSSGMHGGMARHPVSEILRLPRVQMF